MSEFTPGKWTTDDYGAYVFAHEEQMMICMMRGYGYLKSEGLSDEDITEVQKANARLIAASPVLYELLQRLAYGKCDDCAHLLASARKIIARIDGTEVKANE